MSRSLTPEALDDLSLKGARLHRTLAELGQLNRWLGNTRAVSRAVARCVGQRERVSVVDLGCGGGDILAATGHRLRARGCAVDLLGMDGNPNTVAWARTQHPGLRVEVADIFDEGFQVPACDVLLLSHALYHLPDERVVPFLARQRPQVRDAIVISELIRSPLARLGFPVLAWLLGVSGLTRDDGVQAIARAWTPAELKTILSPLAAPWRLHRVDPFRMLVTVAAIG